jgi:hypothetical protein
VHPDYDTERGRVEVIGFRPHRQTGRVRLRRERSPLSFEAPLVTGQIQRRPRKPCASLV